MRGERGVARDDFKIELNGFLESKSVFRYGQVVAVKQLHETQPSKRTVAAFENEIKIMSRFPKHPNVVQYLSSVVSQEEYTNNFGTRPMVARLV